jgi:hypothetical protein
MSLRSDYRIVVVWAQPGGAEGAPWNGVSLCEYRAGAPLTSHVTRHKTEITWTWTNN